MSEQPLEELSADQRSTVLAWALHSVLTSDDSRTTLWARLEEMGVPVAELTQDTLPFATPPYSPEQFQQMCTAIVGYHG